MRRGYLVYRASSADGVFELLTSDPMSEPVFWMIARWWARIFQLKTLKLEEVPTGTYFNQSIGAGASAMFSGQTFTATAQTTAGLCGGNGGSIDLMVAGSANFQYLWSNGATTQDLSMRQALIPSRSRTGAAAPRLLRPPSLCNRSQRQASMSTRLTATVKPISA